MKKRGKGMAIMWYPVGPGGTNVSTARLEMSGEGLLTAFVGSPDVGQGSSTVLAQIAAHALSIPLDWVRTVAADSNVTPPDHGSVGSRVTYVQGNAVRLACEQMRDMLLAGARDLLDPAIGGLRIEAGRFVAEDNDDVALDVATVARHLIGETGKPLECSASFTPPGAPVDRNTGQGVLFPSFVYATQIAEVEVDTQTGEVTVLRIVAAHDSGVVINPLLVEGQIAGGIAQGLGMALSEEIIFRDGRTLNPSFMDYALPSALDMPDVRFIHVETVDDAGPYGAKCVAEPSLVPTAPAILNAIYDAVGVRIHDLPATPEKILSGLSCLET